MTINLTAPHFLKKPQILCLADFHLGLHQDSVEWHAIAEEFFDWLFSEVIQKREIKTMFIAGDIFHDRRSIQLQTLNVAKRFFQRLEQHEIQVFMIPGNHDCFYRNERSDVNSIGLLNRQLFRVFEQASIVPFLIKKSDNTTVKRYVLFAPWFFDLKDWFESSFVQKNKDITLSTVIGHFEIQNFIYQKQQISQQGCLATEILKIAPYIITGHYHTYQKRVFNDGQQFILYLGSPYQQNFGERDTKKGVVIYNLLTHETEFIENDVSPKHVFISAQKLLKQQYDRQWFEKNVRNQIVAFVIDVPLSFLEMEKILQKIRSYFPRQFRVEQCYQLPFFSPSLSANFSEENNKLFRNLSEVFEQYFTSYSFPSHIQPQQVLDYCRKLCQHFQQY